MEFLNQWALPILVVWPLLSSILVFMSKDERLIKWGSVLASLLPLGVSIYMLAAYDYSKGGMAFEVNVPWIPAINSNIHLGADNLSLPLIFLTALLTTLSLYYSAYVIKDRVREYFGLFHLLALSMFGVFIALDFVVFYVFWEISLVPMYLLIGIWGGKNRNYASIKFFIYTLVGSVAMLLAILGTYFATGTFDILEAAAARPFADLPPQTALLLTSLAFWGFFLGFAFKVPSFLSHLAARRAHRGAHGRQRHFGRHLIETGRLRFPAHYDPALSDGCVLLGGMGGRPGRHRHRLRRAGLRGPNRPEAPDRLQLRFAHGVRGDGHRRCVRGVRQSQRSGGL